MGGIRICSKTSEMENLKGGDELFQAESVKVFYEEVINKWEFDSSPARIALFLGCSKHKPYSESFMHKKVIGLLKKNDLEDKIQQYIIGEPLAVCPREWEEKYPAAHYDFPPDKLGEEGKRIFVQRVRRFLQKASNHYEMFVTFAPNHHKGIILEAGEKIIDLKIVPYNLYKLPILFETLQEVTNDGV